MQASVTRTVYRLFGIPVGSVTHQHFAAAGEQTSTITPPKPMLTEHGYAYQCTHCGELLLEGLREPIASADEAELALRHACKDTL